MSVGSNGNPSISGSGVPVINGSYTVHLTSAPADQPVILMMGDSDSSWVGIPLPFPLIASYALHR